MADPNGEYKCYPSECGHIEFPPRDVGACDDEYQLLKYLKVKFSGWNRVSIERIVSSQGICNIYEFLAYKNPEKVNNIVHKQFLERPGDASVITHGAIPGSLCEEAMSIFAGSYGAHCGSVALNFMPFKGLYVTGGVSKQSAKFLMKDPKFQEAYLDKGYMRPMLENVPLLLVHCNDLAERGLQLRAVRLLKQHMAGRGPRLKAVNTEVDDPPEALVPPRECVQVY